MKADPPMTVIVSRVELFDAYSCSGSNKYQKKNTALPSLESNYDDNNQRNVVIEPYWFERDIDINRKIRRKPEVQVVRNKGSLHLSLNDHQKQAETSKPHIKDIPNPFLDVHDKYWSQRHRLFSRFDEGVQLDTEGWYSITPEVIADHVAYKLGSIAASVAARNNLKERKICILEAFCGCGGNAVAFGKSPNIDLVVCIDIDRSKLRRAAHNAAVYKIPPEKLIFIEANALTVLECYHFGELLEEQRDKNIARNIHHRLMMSMTLGSKTQHTENVEGYTISGVEMLPAHIHGVHIDPPWGGCDYGSLGVYDLTRNLFISQKDNRHKAFDLNNANSPNSNVKNPLDGRRLLAMTARASNVAVYTLPRNTGKVCIGQAALNSGYRGNCEFEEQFLNGRLKCVSAYFGHDFRPLDML